LTAEDPIPVREDQITGDEDGASFVAFGQEREEISVSSGSAPPIARASSAWSRTPQPCAPARECRHWSQPNTTGLRWVEKRGESVSGVQQFPFVDDVVAVEDGASFVAGQEHGYTLRNTGSNQIPGSGAPAVMKQPGRHADATARVAQCAPPRTHRYPVTMEHTIVLTLWFPGSTI